MPKIQIRPGVATDVNTLMAIDHSSQTDYVWQLDVQNDEAQKTIFLREIRLPRSVVISYPRPVAALSESWNHRSGVLVALANGIVIGYTRMNETYIQCTALLTDVIVSPRYRRQGVATAMILAAQSWAISRKNNRMMIEMIAKNAPAIRLAQKLGFEFSGYNDAYYETKDIALFFGRSIS
jgi:GNAT superfamily N-acetyltransferase